MYAVVEHDKVTLGPMSWNHRLFADHLEAENEISVNIPVTNNTGLTYVVNDTIKIMPITIIEPNYNQRSEQLAGPFYVINADDVIGTYLVIPLPIEMIKSHTKDTISANRYKYETRGIKVTLQGQDYSVSTARETRGVYFQAHQASIVDTPWKFPEGWLTLSVAELQTITTAITTHIKDQFLWESQKIQLIDMATSVDELLAIELKRAGFE